MPITQPLEPTAVSKTRDFTHLSHLPCYVMLRVTCAHPAALNRPQILPYLPLTLTWQAALSSQCLCADSGSADATNASVDCALLCHRQRVAVEGHASLAVHAPWLKLLLAELGLLCGGVSLSCLRELTLRILRMRPDD